MLVGRPQEPDRRLVLERRKGIFLQLAPQRQLQQILGEGDLVLDELAGRI